MAPATITPPKVPAPVKMSDLVTPSFDHEVFYSRPTGLWAMGEPDHAVRQSERRHGYRVKPRWLAKREDAGGICPIGATATLAEALQWGRKYTRHVQTAWKMFAFRANDFATNKSR